MKTDNFAMLLPCGTDVFTGVEYVCCPDGKFCSLYMSLCTQSNSMMYYDHRLLV